MTEIVRAEGVRRDREGEVAHDRRDRAERRARGGGDSRAGDRPGRADRAAGGGAALAPARAGDPQEQDRDPRPLPAAARARRSHRRSRRADGGGARVPSRRLPPHARGRLGRELRVRRHRQHRRRRVRGERPDVHDPARGARDGDGHREGRAVVPRPGGDAPAAAALVDRRADEPVHLDLDGSPCRRRPAAFHLVLLDNGRTRALADEVGRDALRCIRCSACINVCPVYRQTGGHAYHTPYAGPIGAILQPQLDANVAPRPRCRSPRPSAAPARTSVRCGSTSPRSSCTSARRWSLRSGWGRRKRA